MEVMQARTDESQKALLESWLSKEAVPVEQAVLGAGGGGPGGWLGAILTFFARRPMYLFGLLYFAKRLLRYLEQQGRDDDVDRRKEL